jgi:PadR family transcriptional regulator, regulatory protein AphA
MSLTHAILGLLQCTAPMTGYDLKTQYFDESIGYFWPADQAQVYRTLDKMAEEGWVESRIEVQEGRPNRKIYAITEAGYDELQRWLVEHHPVPAVREPFLIQTYFAGMLPNGQILDLLAERIKAHQALLEEYQQVPLPPLDELTDQREHTMARLTLEFGLRYQQMQMEWIKLAMETISKIPDL